MTDRAIPLVKRSVGFFGSIRSGRNEYGSSTVPVIEGKDVLFARVSSGPLPFPRCGRSESIVTVFIYFISPCFG